MTIRAASLALLLLATQVTTVILMRHGEKASDSMTNDPALSEAGVARANELMRVLAGADVTAIYTTPLRRTPNQIVQNPASVLILPLRQFRQRGCGFQ